MTPSAVSTRAWARTLSTTGPGTVVVVAVFGVLAVVLIGYSLSADPSGRPFTGFGLQTWSSVLGDGYTLTSLWNSVVLALYASVLTLVPAAAVAVALWRVQSPVATALWIAALVAPTLVAVVIRAHGWLLILGTGGPLGGAFSDWLYHRPAVLLAQVHTLLPFAVIPIYIALRRIPPNVYDAARDLGAGPVTLGLDIVTPLAIRGAFSAAQLVFAMAVSSFAVPALLGGGRLNLLPQAIYQSIQTLSWPAAAAQALILLFTTLVVMAVLRATASLTQRLLSDGDSGAH
ncbi:ABC transporter permease subunit [Rhodococcus sp. BP-252]|uniref:ABC transporter permease n=1 Tax=unclassified Rhodococcus (in: high G+C Gram-positive bacteria) TaxID=192944 RepID=UPI001C9B5CE1|nr:MULTISPECIES: ABC transporter permease subunit [unclassified Rhodococcus (in: high G+C Gram-positive bacteria)]MBY6414522.1 ABC transporter permease subunit [Rhodococcus sp. BP-320]MBY6419569.1 ABC transporter permease subunit [Rhodococcus sp. BP-321]MBY6424189.1 ABC transporter permease subunit [Rhodococcus sp. BP-324]MBY6429524.1 ABC transporter permease subunit [Rhodococcus sp. BP-323]MBY6434411.1 ABC transporter permease subunit [Rhodococcus sp. BP-322]